LIPRLGIQGLEIEMNNRLKTNTPILHIGLLHDAIAAASGVLSRDPRTAELAKRLYDVQTAEDFNGLRKAVANLEQFAGYAQ
jgi:hypothetical protein